MRHRGDPNGQYWMGAIRNPEDATSWKWINGRDVTVSFWNLPGGDENCARFDGTKGWLWSDTNCLADLHFMCQHQPLTCGKPEQPPNSTMEPLVYVVGTEVEYKCDPGHVLIGPAKRTCLKSGFFDGVPPICRYIQCGHPAPIRHGQYHLVNGTRHYGSRVQYSCDEGYTMIDRGLLTCDDDKRWDGRPPRCRREEITANKSYLNYESMKACNTQIGHGYLCSPIDPKFYPYGPDFDPYGPHVYPYGPHVDPYGPHVDPLGPHVDPYGPHVDPSALMSTLHALQVDDNIADGSHGRPGTVIPSQQDDALNEDLINSRGNAVDSPNYKGAGATVEMGPKMQTGGIIALGVFGGVVLLSAIVTTIVILVKSMRISLTSVSGDRLVEYYVPDTPSPLHYRRWNTLLALPFTDVTVGRRELLPRAAPCADYYSSKQFVSFGRSQNTSSKKYMRRQDDVTTSSDASSSEGNGLNKYYKRAWDNLRDSSGEPVHPGRDVEKAHHHHHRRGDEGEFRSTRSGTHEGLRDESEMTVNDVAAMYTRPEKRRHHHHHHSHRHQRDVDDDRRDHEWKDRRKY
ncbi:hypothetical protein HAZT_HAZT009360 [Hyalella azteca]|uniref:Sushi domain-containing protein n=1 Tax=Hyalella azteca TaxID=294128 RepID=A0A6A0H3Z4_HYAAZ|nr:hypothetical protein HAZT_HAZT009360 [Hyalella azteca]